MEKFSIEIKEDQYLIKLKREEYDLSTLNKIILNLRIELFNDRREMFTEMDDIHSLANDYDESAIDYLGDK